jgi:hypothetical protein
MDTTESRACRVRTLPNRGMGIAAFLLVVVLAPRLMSAQKAEALAYENRACGISILYPEGWLIKEITHGPQDPKERMCAIRVQPKDLARHLKEDDNVDTYSIELYVDNRDYAAALAEAGFERGQTGWVAHAEGDSRAEEISSPEWVGIRAATQNRCYQENGGGYVGICDGYRAVLNNRSQISVTIEGRAKSAFDLVLGSVKFTGASPKREKH